MAFQIRHLQQINQTYFQHFKNALTYSFICQHASVCFVIHAFYPDVLVQTGSKLIESLHQRLTKHKDDEN